MAVTLPWKSRSSAALATKAFACPAESGVNVVARRRPREHHPPGVAASEGSCLNRLQDRRPATGDLPVEQHQGGLRHILPSQQLDRLIRPRGNNLVPDAEFASASALCIGIDGVVLHDEYSSTQVISHFLLAGRGW